MRKHQANRLAIAESSTLLGADNWHPLDGVPAPEYIPPTWIGPHVGLRLVEAFKTLSRMPMGGAGVKSGVWPDYRHDWEDLLAQVNTDADIKAQEARDQNRARLMPTAEDVSRMEKAIVWPAHYLGSRPIICRIVQRVAVYRAVRGFDLDMLSRKMRKPADAVRRANRNGLDAIADGLRREKIMVF